ncbi:MAG: DUF58 domain-containing protein [Cyanobacterium sp. T60_A2020_053]|nr:DUF58 domain-containing protein [Cyanobacterium sp. T60_A2020_053]
MRPSPHYRNNFISSCNQWLENHFATPAYSGWVVFGIALSFFGAATNTMAGWLYVLSGTLFALMGLNIFVALKTVKKLEIKRAPIAPVSAGDELTIQLKIHNPTKSPKSLITIIDQLPFVLSAPVTSNIEIIQPFQTIDVTYYTHAQKRGVYYWHELQIKTAAPVGLFYCSRQREVEAKAIVYPQVLPLKNCPLIDTIGREDSKQRESERIYQNASEGVTKAIRQYRFGDPTRLIHWRSSARFGDFQVRELETITGGEEVIICLDNIGEWDNNLFEEAVIAAASLYFYASRQQLNVKLWTADLGMVKGNYVVLETLAGTNPTEVEGAGLPNLPLIWLSSNPDTLTNLPNASRWLLFSPDSNPKSSHQGIIYTPTEALENQLQKPLR